MKKRLGLITIAILLLGIIGMTVAFGASASLSVSGGGSYTKGSTVTVTYTYSGDSIGSATSDISYNASVLEYVSCSGGTAPGSASGVFSVTSANGQESSSLTVTLTFKAIGSGSSTVSVKPVDVYNYDFEFLDCSSSSTTVTVTNPAPTVSSNANLSALSVSAGNLSPAFSPSRTSYDVYVGADVTVCTVSVDTEDPDASVSVTGSKDLSVGENIRKVVVTAPSGNTKTYTLYIYRAESSSNNNSGEGEDPDNGDEGDNNEDEKKEIIVDIDGVEYVIVENIKNEDLPEKFNLVIGKFDGKDIPLIKDSKLKHTLALLKNQETGDQKWFFYDEEESVFFKTTEFSPEDVMKYVKLSANEQPQNDNVEKDNVVNNNNVMLYVLCGTLALLAIVVIILQFKILNGKKSKKKAN